MPAKTLLVTSFALAAMMTGLSSAQAAAPQGGWTYNALVDNDSFAHISDRHYTNGLYFSATSGARTECATCAWFADNLMLPNADPTTYRYGFFLGQSILTPEDLSLSIPDPTDRPYGGWLYLGARVYREGGNVLDRLEAKLGVVGPSSGADAVQRWWHAMKLWGGVPPQGWRHQLKDEPGIVLTGQRIWRVTLLPDPFGIDLLPEANISLGNIFTYAAAGITLRVGQNLRADWGPPRVEPGIVGSDFIDERALAPVAWYGYVAVEGRAFARNLFLDGNTYKHGPSVDKEAFVADFTTGAAFLWDWFSLRVSYTERTQEFKTQRNNDQFFSVGLSFVS